MRDDLGTRVKRVASDDIPHGHPAVEGNIVGFAAKTNQIDRFVRPTDAEATTILRDEEFVLFVGGLHELKVETDWAPAEVAEGDLLFIDPTDNSVSIGAPEGTAEVQSIRVDATRGTYRLSFDGEDSAAIRFDATAAELRAALEAIDSIDPGDVAVTGGPGDSGGTRPYIVTFGGDYEGEDVPAIVATDIDTTGTITVRETTAGAAGAGTDALPLGVVEEVDTTRTPDVALVNTNAWQAFQGS